MFEPEAFRIYCTEVLVTLLGLFGARGIVPLAPRRYAPDYCAQRRASTNPMVLSSNQRHTRTCGFGVGQNFQFARIFTLA